MSKYKPDGWHSVTPRLFADDVTGLVEFLKQAFNAEGDARIEPCQISIGDSLVMVSGTGVRDVMPAFLYLYIEDVDDTYQRAIAAGAESLEAPQDMPYGDRRAMIKDPGGNTWQIATHNEAAFQAFLKSRS
jgi:PhnB protein